MSDKNYTQVKVTLEVTYLIPMATDTVSEINGWTVPEVIQSWFKYFNINSSHATRDAWELGNSKVIKDIKVIEK